MERELESLAAVAPGSVRPGTGAAPTCLAEAALFFSASLICSCRAFWFSVSGSPVLWELPPNSTRVANSASANRDTSVSA